MRYRILSILIPVILTLPANPVFAGSAKEASMTYNLGEIVVTAEKIQEYVENHPLDVQVVERKEIVERNLPTVEEILKTMPGVEVYSTSGVGSRISIRGSGRSTGVSILLNGRPLNSNQHGGQDLSSIPVAMIESVSVFKPPVPVWLGPGGSDGVINILTRAPDRMKEKARQRTTVKGGGGSYGFAEGSATHMLPMAGGTSLLSVTGTRRDGKRTNSDRADGAFALNWNREEDAGAKYEINSRYYQAESGSSGPLDNPTPDARQEYRKGSLDTRYAGVLGETGALVATAYGDRVSVSDRSQSGTTSTLDDYKLGLKGDATWSEPEGDWDLRIGGMSEWDTIDHTLSGTHQRFRNGIGGEYDRRFGALTATGGLRADVTNDFGLDPGFSGGVGWGLSKRTLLKARAGYTVNVPGFEQLYQTSHGSIDQTRGNPDLREEKVWSYELGVEHGFGKDRLVQLMLFRADTSDLIAYQRGADKIYRPVNLSVAERMGIELTGQYRWATGLSVETTGTLQRSKDRDTGHDLPYTPAIKLKNTVQYTLPNLKTRLEGTLRYEGVRYSQSENLSAQRLDDYVVVDIKATQPCSMTGLASDLYLRIDNLFDTSHEIHLGYPDDGFRIVAGLQMRF